MGASMLEVVKAMHETVEMISIKRSLGKIQTTLNDMMQRYDQLITREIKSAYEALSDAMTTNSEYTRKMRLDFAENNLLKNTNLDSSLCTGGLSNNYLMAISHYGLSFICKLRGDDVVAAKHLLRAFEMDPRKAREELLPELYEGFFKNKCENANRWYKEQLAIIYEKDYTGKQLLDKTGAFLEGAGGVIGGILLKNHAVERTAVRDAGKRWSSSTPEHYRLQAKIALDIEYERKIDEDCKRIATKLLYE